MMDVTSEDGAAPFADSATGIIRRAIENGRYALQIRRIVGEKPALKRVCVGVRIESNKTFTPGEQERRALILFSLSASNEIWPESQLSPAPFTIA
ncbi:MAG: hypothetical protein DMG30_04675 [Acidobacteria bacterium]|nr:MAG: hypothetical protein DMG30_04675 [Acidobacteriota bacterium]